MTTNLPNKFQLSQIFMSQILKTFDLMKILYKYIFFLLKKYNYLNDCK